MKLCAPCRYRYGFKLKYLNPLFIPVGATIERCEECNLNREIHHDKHWVRINEEIK